VTRAMLEERAVVGENVLRLRTQRGWTQKRLEKESGVNNRTIRGIERGLSAAHESTLVKLAGSLGLQDVDELFTPYDPETAPPAVREKRNRQQEIFNLDVDELKRALARLQRDDAEAGDRAYRLLSARIRTLTLAVRKERWKGTER
jgi:transcriptional regulator with XRE-family HTH domain